MYLAGKHTYIELNSSRIKILSIKGKIEASKYSFRNCRNAFFLNIVSHVHRGNLIDFIL